MVHLRCVELKAHLKILKSVKSKGVNFTKARHRMKMLMKNRVPALFEARSVSEHTHVYREKALHIKYIYPHLVL